MNLKDKKNISVISLAIVCVLLAASTVYFGFFNKPATASYITKDAASQKGLDYVNNVLLQGKYKAQIASAVEDIANESLYKFDIGIAGQKISSYITKDGKFFFPQGINLEEESSQGSSSTSSGKEVVGNFKATGDAVCMQDNKPVIYFFYSNSCPHCLWEKPVISAVADKFKDVISYRPIEASTMKSDGEDMKTFSRYSTGGVPTIVLGCKYVRVGSGETMGQDKESAALTSLICDLTKGQPAGVCSQVKK